MKINNRGITRLVLEFNKIVIKVPRPKIWRHFIIGLLANIDEYQTWSYSEYKEYLCPVLWISLGGWILVMRKVDRILKDSEYDLMIVSKAKEHFPGDDKVENYGWLNNKLVKLDYGQ